ncbi:carboxypeptidase-like regulatory domain-containing protein [Paenibacillus sp. CN-4]|uniref:carboxypeptidase-like regulatory domain-containing protein n=1 Tax=Paenibacillus nanchangensis TaxID=3348343 RepID=UPI003977EF86
MVYGYGSSLSAAYIIRNNILYTTRPVRSLTESPTIVYYNNSYYSVDGTLKAPASDPHPLLGEPRMQDPGKGSSGSQAEGPALHSLEGYKLKADSPLINRGLTIVDAASDPVKDFAGRAAYNGGTDPGALEFYDDSTSTAALAGRVTNRSGKGISGAVVAESLGSGLQAVTDELGYYTIKAAAVGSQVNLKAAKSGFEESESGIFTIQAGDVTTTDFQLASNLAEGLLSGKVFNGHLEAAAGVNVVLSQEGTMVHTTVSGANGEYSFPAVEAGENYTVSADKTGYRPAKSDNVHVEPGQENTAPNLYVVETEAQLVSSFQRFLRPRCRRSAVIPVGSDPGRRPY